MGSAFFQAGDLSTIPIQGFGQDRLLRFAPVLPGTTLHFHFKLLGPGLRLAFPVKGSHLEWIALLAYAGLPADDVAVSIFAGENGGAKLERKSKWSGEIICKYLVRKARLELARPKPLEPKSSASTNSATLAIALSYAE